MNTGDDAIIYALLRALTISYPKAIFSVFSQTPIAVPSESDVQINLIKSSPIQVLNEIRLSTIFIMGGGTQIYDYGDKLDRLKILTLLFIIVMWAKIVCNKLYFVCIGIEKPTTLIGQFLSKQICRFADCISVRDSNSYEILNGWGFESKTKLSFDLTSLLEPDKSNNRPLVKGKILGVSILPFFQIYHHDLEKDQLFIGQFVKGLNKWLDSQEYNLIYLFIFSKSKADDTYITIQLLNKLKDKEQVKIIPYNPDPVATLSYISQTDAFVGMRYHSCMFAYLSGIPMIIIDYFQKCQALAKDIELPDYAVVSIDDILKGYFDEIITNLISSPDRFVPHLDIESARDLTKKGIPCGSNR